MDFSSNNSPLGSRSREKQPRNNGSPWSSNDLVQICCAFGLKSTLELISLPLIRRTYDHFNLPFDLKAHMRSSALKFAVSIPLGYSLLDSSEYFFKGDLIQTGPYRQGLPAVTLGVVLAMTGFALENKRIFERKPKDRFYFNGRVGGLAASLIGFELAKIFFRDFDIQNNHMLMASIGGLSAFFGSLIFSFNENIFINYDKTFGEKTMWKWLKEGGDIKCFFRGHRFNLMRFFPLFSLVIYTHEARKSVLESREPLPNWLGAAFYGSHFTIV